MNIEQIILNFIKGILPKTINFGPFDVTLAGDKFGIQGSVTITNA